MALKNLNLIYIALLLFSYGAFTGCETTGGMGGDSQGSSTPINAKEDRAYKAAMLKCYKTGGSRVVKIQGKLRCY